MALFNIIFLYFLVDLKTFSFVLFLIMTLLYFYSDAINIDKTVNSISCINFLVSMSSPYLEFFEGLRLNLT